MAYVVNQTAGGVDGEVSRQWFSRPVDQRFLSLSELETFKRREADESENFVIRSHEIEIIGNNNPQNIDETRDLWFGLPNGKQVSATHWGFSQIAALAKAPASYLRTLPSALVVDNLTYSLRYNREVEEIGVYVRSNGASLLRAVTGPTYGRVYDHEVITALRRVAGNGTGDTRWKVPGTLDWRTGIYNPDTPVTKDTTTLFASDRDLFVFLVDDKNPIKVGVFRDPRTGKQHDDLMFRGICVTNSEVGAGTLRVITWYLRAVCMNRNLWGVEGRDGITIRHTKFAPDRFLQEVQPAIEYFSEGSNHRLIEGVERAKEAIVADNDEKAIEFLRARGFSSNKAKQILTLHEAEEGHPVRSAWDMAQGITAYARSLRNNSDRFELEEIAGRVLDRVTG